MASGVLPSNLPNPPVYNKVNPADTAILTLAVTSTNAMIKKLGGKRWRALHRLAYVAAIAGVMHYYMQTKKDVRQPLAFAMVLAILLGWRLMDYWRTKQPAATASAVPAKPKI